VTCSSLPMQAERLLTSFTDALRAHLGKGLMFFGFRIQHIARKLEIIAAVVTLGGLITPGGRSVAKGVAKGTATAVKEVTGSWGERRRIQRELREAAERHCETRVVSWIIIT